MQFPEGSAAGRPTARGQAAGTTPLQHRCPSPCFPRRHPPTLCALGVWPPALALGIELVPAAAGRLAAEQAAPQRGLPLRKGGEG